MSELRIAKVSTIDYKAGKISVVYPDKSNSVSKLLPCLAFEYNMPKIGDTVIVATIDNSNEGTGVVLGKVWSGKNKPKDGKAGVYRKDLSADGSAYIKYDGSTGVLTLHAKKVKNEEGS